MLSQLLFLLLFAAAPHQSMMMVVVALLEGQSYSPGPAWDAAEAQQPASTLVPPPQQMVSPPPASPPVVAQWYPLEAGVCVNGAPAFVYAFSEPAKKGTSNDWVVQFGAAPTLNFCIDEQHCAIFGVPPTAPPKPGTNTTLTPGGPFSTNCTDNPDFCQANKAQITVGCSMDLLMGNNLHEINASHQHTPFGNATVLHFDGMAVLKNSIAKLLSLGMNKADKVLLTGVAHSGTAVFLHADRVEAQIRKANPGLKQFGALPVDGLHPKHWAVLYMMYQNYADSWFTAALEGLGSMAFDNTASAVLPGCAKLHRGQEWKCMWVNESLPFIQAKLFAVNQMASVWDSQCLLEGMPCNNVLQVACSYNNHYERGYRTCNQYPEYCDKTFVKNVTAPYQQQYIDDYAHSGTHVKKGNGGFFHSCYLGAYFHSGWAGTAIWKIIKIKGLSMQQAIGNWWHDRGSSTDGSNDNDATVDGPICNPTAHPAETCPNGQECPQCGKPTCACPTTATAAWTTDCTWDAASPEPPAWSNDTCADWTAGVPPKNTSGCREPPSLNL